MSAFSSNMDTANSRHIAKRIIIKKSVKVELVLQKIVTRDIQKHVFTGKSLETVKLESNVHIKTSEK